MPVDEPETITLPQCDLDQLLAVATLYLGAFTEDELMSLTEKMALQEVEAVVERYGKRY